MGKYTDDPDWEYKNLKKGKWYAYEKFSDGRISYDQYMSILDDCYEVLSLDEMKDVKEWKEKKQKELAEKKQQQMIDKQRKQKETSELLWFIWIVFCAILGLYIWFTRKSRGY